MFLVLEKAQLQDLKFTNNLPNLRNLLICMYLKGAISGADLSKISFCLHQCGIGGFADLAADPRTPVFFAHSGRPVARALGVDDIEGRLLRFPIPYCDKDGGRRFFDCAAADLFDTLREEFLNSPREVVENAQDLMASSENWRKHSVRTSCAQNEIVVPFGLFLDGAVWRGKGAGKTDSLGCVYVNVIGSRTRLTLFTTRKEYLCGVACGCACRGRCTVQATEYFLKWMIDCAADGRGPPTAYRGQPWTSIDRISAIGKFRLEWNGFRVKFALLECRNDWDQ